MAALERFDETGFVHNPSSHGPKFRFMEPNLCLGSLWWTCLFNSAILHVLRSILQILAGLREPQHRQSERSSNPKIIAITDLLVYRPTNQLVY
jgi:hypothetical protein